MHYIMIRRAWKTFIRPQKKPEDIVPPTGSDETRAGRLAFYRSKITAAWQVVLQVQRLGSFSVTVLLQVRPVEARQESGRQQANELPSSRALPFVFE